MADGGVNGFDYRTRTRDLGTPGRLLGPYSGPPSFPSLSSRDPVNPRDRHHLESIPTSSGIDTDVIWSQDRHHLEARPTPSGILSDIDWDPVQHRLGACPTSFTSSV